MITKHPYKSKEARRKIEGQEQEQIEPWQPLIVNNEILLYHLGRTKVYDCYEPQIYWLFATEAFNRLVKH